ncbi:bifunctional enoyl-CoA hydratase/phosphate acetyltransferase [Clostridium sp. MT-14]|jgi:phosphate butyryltransferase|uniref:Bifunctional enoyl-CoA hydratase/phosphate acetyltransferase n=1 Tax=Clostridium aromativorans TaxID=2836848 RepID=A0ABS8N0D4_9CLOT|nr:MULTISPECIES: bifunctional enoyl-CoA hydratase/phosphate acetyltransferase [Clostridium]KAA8675784.1 bifunctional enoyl-CoA hydratase/phosphate acetyltransferase [Clostridium sp. HV4-5-A1G]MCC9293269.1 bifunctional enoyl-CoA hydratase/phosphate acetyltransferase [Clostridium aromativorans]CAB1251704.1 Phosphate butyryltransferase [Clostridiaceae bacterium BL-3]
MVKKLVELVDIAKEKSKKVLSVAVAQDEEVLKAVTEAVKLGIIDAILVGDKKSIVDILERENLHKNNIEIVNEKDPSKAAAAAVKLVSEGKAQFIMKGMLKTAEMLKAVLNKETGLRKSKLLSHVMIYEVPAYHKLLFLTDGGMLTYPNLEEKIGIIKNAVFVANRLGITLPKVAAISAVEVVNAHMQSTLDAAVLAQMNKRGQIGGCIVDGPLALDVAVSKTSAEHKKITSEVAGDVDILLVPNIEAGNLLGKSMTYFAGAENAGIIVGAKCPVVLVSRTNSAMSKLYSIALGSVVS